MRAWLWFGIAIGFPLGMLTIIVLLSVVRAG